MKVAEPSPYRGVIITVAFAVGIIGLYVAYKESIPSKAKTDSSESAAVPEKEAPPVGAEKREPQVAAPVYLTDPATLRDMIRPETLDDKAFYYLLYQMKIADVKKASEEAKPVTAPAPSEIGKLAPGAWVSLQGTVRTSRVRKELCIPEVGIPAATEYEIEDAHGNLYVVLSVNDTRGIDIDDHVKVVGRFFKMFPHLSAWKAKSNPPKPEGLPVAGQPPKAGVESQPTPVIVAQGLEAPEVLSNPSVLASVEDDTFGEEGKAFYYLIHQVQSLTQDQLKAKADLNLASESISRNPAAVRGKVVMIDGALVHVGRLRLSPNVTGVSEVHRCVIRTRTGQYFWVYTLDPPMDLLPKRDTVRAYGVFFKTCHYTNKEKREAVAPLVIARELKLLKLEETPYLDSTLVVVAVVLVVGFAAILLIERRQSQRMSRRVKELALKTRPQGLNDKAREIAARAHRAKEDERLPGSGSPPAPPPKNVG